MHLMLGGGTERNDALSTRLRPLEDLQPLQPARNDQVS